MSFHMSWAIYSVWLGEEVNVCSWEWIVRKQEEFKIRLKASTSALESIHWARRRNGFEKEYELSFWYGISVFFFLFFSTMHKVPRIYIWKQNNSVSGRKPIGSIFTFLIKIWGHISQWNLIKYLFGTRP